MQETKLSVADVWPGPAVDGYYMLHSGRSISQDGTAVVTREGVGIILNSIAAVTCRAAGEV